VLGPDGKRNVWVQDAGGNATRRSITPKQVLFKLPGGPYTEVQLQEATEAAAADAAAAAALATSTQAGVLADAWEMAGENMVDYRLGQAHNVFTIPAPCPITTPKHAASICWHAH
jgi:hypothetical protein